jgi:hypothetical protein
VSDIQQSRRYHHMGRRASLRDDDRSRASHWHQQIFDLTKPPTPPCGKPNSMRDVNENRSPDFYQWTYVCRYLAVNGNCGDFKVMSMWCSCPRRCRPKRRLLLPKLTKKNRLLLSSVITFGNTTTAFPLCHHKSRCNHDRVKENRQFVQSLSLSLTCALSLPDLLDGSSQTNVVGLKLVPTPADNEDGEEVEPVGGLADEGNAPRREVVGDAGPIGVVRRVSTAQFQVHLTGSPCMCAG